MCKTKTHVGVVLSLLLPLFFDGFAVAYNIGSPKNDDNLLLVQTVSVFIRFDRYHADVIILKNNLNPNS